MSFVSTLINQPVVQPFLFTNYRHQPNNLSHYLSVPDAQIWKAIMASTAAPGYFEDVQIGSYILQDGGILSNNPAAIALHEARGLWGRDTHIQCLLSLGTGQYAYLQRNDNMVTTNDKHVKQKPSTSLKEKLTKIVASATDTEGITTIVASATDTEDCHCLNC
jgi:calcium-independent phospholipase A2-gamma